MIFKEKDNPSFANGMGLQSLLDEPQRLSREANKLNIELEALVNDNYKIFINNLTCNLHLRSEDKKLNDISNSLEKNLLELSNQCVSFKEKVNTYISNHKRNRKTLQHHLSLLELLEVPQLVDTCARNGFHDEALELANFINSLERRHLLANEVKNNNNSNIQRSGSDVIKDIVNEVHSTLTKLRKQLLQNLTENITLPKEIQIIGILRKLDGLLIDRHLSHERHDSEAIANSISGSSSAANVLDNKVMSDEQRDILRQHYSQCSEIRLQMDFLEARTIWLHRSADGISPLRQRAQAVATPQKDQPSAIVTNSSNDINSTNGTNATLGPYGKAIEMLETRRAGWFAVITQFNTLFQDSNDEPMSSDGQPSGFTPMRSNLISDAIEASPIPVLTAQSYSTAAVLNSWTTRQVNHLLRELQALLPQIEEGASVRAVLEQAMFFSSRMSQVGCDFSGLLEPLFHDAIISRFSSELHRATKNFKIMLLTERISALEASSSKALGKPSQPLDTTSLNKDKLIPLYSHQDISMTVTSASSNTSTAAASDSGSELAAPQLLMRFPPIAYFLNTVLANLNFLRDCPMISLEQPALSLLFESFMSISLFLIDKASELRDLGDKYLNEGVLKDFNNNKQGKKSSTKDNNKVSKEYMDKLYGHCIALEMFPHILVCFDTIFQNNSIKLDAKLKAFKAKQALRASNNNNNIASAGKLPCLLKNLYDAKDLLDAVTVERLAIVWGKLVSGGVIEDGVLEQEYKPISAVRPTTQASQDSATGGNKGATSTGECKGTILTSDHTGASANEGSASNAVSVDSKPEPPTTETEQNKDNAISSNNTATATGNSSWDEDFGDDF